MKKTKKATVPFDRTDHTIAGDFQTDLGRVTAYRYVEQGQQALRFQIKHGQVYEDFFHHVIMSDSYMLATLRALQLLLGPRKFAAYVASVQGKGPDPVVAPAVETRTPPVRSARAAIRRRPTRKGVKRG